MLARPVEFYTPLPPPYLVDSESLVQSVESTLDMRITSFFSQDVQDLTEVPGLEYAEADPDEYESYRTTILWKHGEQSLREQEFDEQRP